MLFPSSEPHCQGDNDFSIIKNQVEKNFSIGEERNIVYRYKKSV